jgi:uncharacterized protein YndB with AHSA1/START domain
MDTGELAELHYADGPSAEASIDIAAPPERVWALVSDLQLPARFSTEFQGADLLGGVQVPELGARFVGRNHHPAVGSWETTSTITAFDPPREFAYDVESDDGRPSASWRFSLEPIPSGTRLTQWMRMGPGRSGINPAIDAMPDKESKILRRRLAEHRANMEATLAGIKSLAEE